MGAYDTSHSTSVYLDYFTIDTVLKVKRYILSVHEQFTKQKYILSDWDSAVVLRNRL